MSGRKADVLDFYEWKARIAENRARFGHAPEQASVLGYSPDAIAVGMAENEALVRNAERLTAAMAHLDCLPCDTD